MLPDDEFDSMYIFRSSTNKNYEIMIPIRFDYDEIMKRAMIEYIVKTYKKYIISSDTFYNLDFDQWKRDLYQNHEHVDTQLEIKETGYYQFKAKIHSGIQLNKMFCSLQDKWIE